MGRAKKADRTVVKTREDGVYIKAGKYLVDKREDGQRIYETLLPITDMTLKEAADFLKVRIAEVKKGEYAGKRADGSLTVAEAVDIYVHRYAEHLDSYDQTLRYLLMPIKRLLGTSTASSLSVDTVREYARVRSKEYCKVGGRTVKGCNRKVGYATIAHEFDSLCAALNYLVRTRQYGLKYNPVFGWRPELERLRKSQDPKRATKNAKPIVLDDGKEDEVEWKKLLMASNADQRIRLTIQYEAGLRIGEVRSLRWSWINLEQDLICLKGWDVPLDANGRVIEGADPVRLTKNGENREVPISKKLHELLVTLPRNHVLVCCHKNGRPYVNLYKGFNAARDAAGLAKNVTPHALRRTRATIWDRIDSKACQKALGHANAAAQKPYVAVTADRLRAMISAG